MVSCGISPAFAELSPSLREITYVLLTRLPLFYRNIATTIEPSDLHVLGTPPALVLSQDQTLQKFYFLLNLIEKFSYLHHKVYSNISRPVKERSKKKEHPDFGAHLKKSKDSGAMLRAEVSGSVFRFL